jgi:uncharacterized protein
MATIIFKPTEACNARCAYCDVVWKSGGKKTMSFETLEVIFKRIDEYLTANPMEEVDLVWHGGEPLLLGVDYFNKALEFQNMHCRKTCSRIHHAVQTNLTLMRQEFIDVFLRLGIHSLGTSFDPQPGLRGIGRQCDSEKYNREFFKGLEILQINNFSWGFIYVVTKKSLTDPLGIFYYLTNLSIGKGFSMMPVLMYGDAARDIAVSPQEYVDFLGAIFPVWYRHRVRYPNVDPFSGLHSTIVKKEPTLSCADSGTCATSHIYIGPQGEVSQCGRSADWNIIWYDTIHDRTLAEIFSDPRKDVFKRRNRTLAEGECSGCRFWWLCHGGCPLDSFPRYKDLLHKSEWCVAKKDFLEKYFEPVTGITIAGPDESSSKEYRE